jgi:hypothetical protein
MGTKTGKEKQQGRAGDATAAVLDKGESLVTSGATPAEAGAVKVVSIRLTDFEHRRIKSAAAAAGVPLATACARAVNYLISDIEKGRVEFTRAGLQPKG